MRPRPQCALALQAFQPSQVAPASHVWHPCLTIYLRAQSHIRRAGPARCREQSRDEHIAGYRRAFIQAIVLLAVCVSYPAIADYFPPCALMEMELQNRFHRLHLILAPLCSCESGIGWSGKGKWMTPSPLPPPPPLPSLPPSPPTPPFFICVFPQKACRLFRRCSSMSLRCAADARFFSQQQSGRE